MPPTPIPSYPVLSHPSLPILPFQASSHCQFSPSLLSFSLPPLLSLDNFLTTFAFTLFLSSKTPHTIYKHHRFILTSIPSIPLRFTTTTNAFRISQLKFPSEALLFSSLRAPLLEHRRRPLLSMIVVARHRTPSFSVSSLVV